MPEYLLFLNKALVKEDSKYKFEDKSVLQNISDFCTT